MERRRRWTVGGSLDLVGGSPEPTGGVLVMVGGGMWKKGVATGEMHLENNFFINYQMVR